VLFDFKKMETCFLTKQTKKPLQAQDGCPMPPRFRSREAFGRRQHVAEVAAMCKDQRPDQVGIAIAQAVGLIDATGFSRCCAGRQDPEEIDAAHVSMMQCIDAGSEVAEKLFSSCVEKSVEKAVATAMEIALKQFIAFVPDGGAKVAIENVDKARIDMLMAAKDVPGIPKHTSFTQKHCKCVCLGGWWVLCGDGGGGGCAPSVLAGVQVLRAGRKISVRYRSTVLTDLEVSNLYEEAQMRLDAAIKAAGIAQDLLAPLEAEAMLGIEHPGGDWAGMRALAPELVEQASTTTQ